VLAVLQCAVSFSDSINLWGRARLLHRKTRCSFVDSVAEIERKERKLERRLGEL
jgi:hypothetical protein